MKYEKVFSVELESVSTGITLKDLADLIPYLIKKYGAKAIVEWDAGYESICVRITPSKKVKSASVP